MSLSVAGVWAVGVWDQTVWADGVWREGEFVAAVTTKGGSVTEDRIRKQHRKMLRKQLHLKKKPLEFNILVQEDGEVEIDGVLVPVELVGKIPTKLRAFPKLITKDEVMAELALLSREREVKAYNRAVSRFKAAVIAANKLEERRKLKAHNQAIARYNATVMAAQQLEEEMRQMEEEMLVMLLAHTLD